MHRCSCVWHHHPLSTSRRDRNESGANARSCRTANYRPRLEPGWRCEGCWFPVHL